MSALALALAHTPTPILTIPPEIVAEILTLLSPSPLPLSIPPRAQDPIWKATQICSRWRDVALSMPQLWCSLNIQFPQSTDDLALQRTIEASLECLRRSDPALLSITLSLQTDHKQKQTRVCLHPGYTGIPTLFSPSFLAPHSPRVQNLTLKTFVDLTSHALDFAFPNLRHLSIDVPDFQRRMHVTALTPRSGNTITHLTISYPLMSADWCIILSRTPDLQNLWTSNPLPYEVVRAVMTCSLCPVLRELRCALYEEAFEDFMDMVEERGDVLKRVTLECMKFRLGEEGRERVRRLCDTGMVIEVLEPPITCF